MYLRTWNSITGITIKHPYQTFSKYVHIFITDKSSNLLIWDANTRRATWLDSSIRDPLNVLIWSKTGPNLAIGSYRGNLMLYNHRTSRKVPVLGKHSKAITCGAWSESNLLVCLTFFYQFFFQPKSLEQRKKKFQKDSERIPRGFPKPPEGF